MTGVDAVHRPFFGIIPSWGVAVTLAANSRRFRRGMRFGLVLLGLFTMFHLAGCKHHQKPKDCPSEFSLGWNARDLVDIPSQTEMEKLANMKSFAAQAEDLRKLSFEEGMKARNPNAPPHVPRNVLCLSGGGSYGAFSAGILCGWTAQGTRPTFDVVTGISTGALIAPFAFLGPAYDEQMKQFYTTLESDDLYKTRYVRGLFSESLADNSGLAEKVDEVLTPQLLGEIAQAHQQGRRLYVGSTAVDSKRFVVWDIGAIASRGRPEDKKLIKQILLGSSAIPGFFPPQHIDLNVDGQCVTERHVDGGVSQALFFQPPYVPPEYRSEKHNADLAGTNVYCIVAGKLYADPEEIKPNALSIAAKNVSTVIYAQTRGDLMRLFTATMLSGMNFYMTAIPTEYPAPLSSTAFEIPALTGMFNEGYKMMCCGNAWRRTPPGVEPGESLNHRDGVCLSYLQRGPIAPPQPSDKKRGRGSDRTVIPTSNEGIPAVPVRR